MRQHAFQHLAQRWNVPLTAVQLVDQAAFDLRGVDVEHRVEGVAGRLDAQVGVQDHQRIAHGAHDRFGGVACGLGFAFAALLDVDVEQREHRAVDLVVEAQVGTHAQRIPAALRVLHFALAHAHGVDDLANERVEIQRRRLGCLARWSSQGMGQQVVSNTA